MRARWLVLAALLSLTACEKREPATPYGASGHGYPLPDDEQAQAAQAEAEQTPEPLWPRRFTSGDTSFATYEPQVDSWKDDKLEARVAVEVFPPGASTPKYGVVWFETPTQTDRARGVVTLGDVRVLRAHFPTAKDHEAEYLQALRGANLAEAKTVTVDRLEHEVAYGASHETVPAEPVKNDPPAILFSDSPEMLVQVDGPPKLRDEGGGVQRVLNTRALLASARGSFYVWIGDRWFRAPTVEGSFSEARDVPPELEPVKARLAGSQTVDLYGDVTDRARQGLKVVVATRPTALIETRGAPVYEQIAGTTLSFVNNTDSDVLRDDTTGQTYVLLSGRWFRAPSLSGPWAYVSGNDLPTAFRSIPRGHREARVLASVPSTPEAEEATIAASVPETATVDRGKVGLAVAYDGDPDFEPVEGMTAPLKYAINSGTPVIATPDGMYYAVENGVWFVSASPTGPWTVATSIPDVIYAIPISSPIHYVTYVRIYGYSPEYAYVGYTPGYLGAFYAGGVVVLGSGYWYRPWIGHVWYGRPSYWHYAYYGPYGYYGRYGYSSWAWHGPAVVRPNVYRTWAPTVVHAPPARAALPPRYPTSPRYPASPSVGPRVSEPGSRAKAAPVPPGSYRAPAPSYGTAVPPSSAPLRVPAPSYRAPAPSYRAPAPSYRTVPPSYAPAPSFRAPAPSFRPAPSYRAAPPPSYRAPPPSYRVPSPSFRAPAPSFRAPAAPRAPSVSRPSGGAVRGGGRGGRR